MPQVPNQYRKIVPQRGHEIENLLRKFQIAEIFSYIAGGYARWMISPKSRPPSPGDIDFYFQDFSSFSKAKQLLTDEGCLLQKESHNALTFAPYNIGVGNRVQLIKTVGDRYGDIFEILNHFDLSVCQAAVTIDSETNHMQGYGSRKFFDTEGDDRLRIIKIGNPMSTMIRCMKYARHGYSIGPKQLVKILNVWDAMSPEMRAATREMISTETSTSLESDLYSMIEA